MDDAGTQLAFTAEKNPEKALVKPFKLYYYTAAKDSAEVIAAPNSSGMPQIGPLAAMAGFILARTALVCFLALHQFRNRLIRP